MAMTPKRRAITFLSAAVGLLLLTQLPWAREVLSIEWASARAGLLAEFFAGAVLGRMAFVAASVLVILMQVPGLIVVVVAALIYPPLEAMALSLFASTLGLVLVFLLARYCLSEYLRPKLSGSRLAPYLEQLERNGLAVTVLLRLLFAMVPPVNWLLGVTRVSLGAYTLGTVLGLLPIVVTVTLIVYQLRSLSSAADLVSVEVLGVMLLVVGLWGGLALLRRRYRRRLPDSSVAGSANER
jgi:uncharacterized membrane protein YdjX (TVP38/TMEM64 family)